MTGLTSEQAKWLKKSDALLFDTDTKDYGSRIRAVRKIHETGVTLEIPVANAVLNDYGPDRQFNPPYNAFAWRPNAQLDPRTTTWLRTVRMGTELSFRWTRDNNSLNLDNADLHFDSLDIVVTNGRIVSTYFVECSIVPTSGYRMIRR